MRVFVCLTVLAAVPAAFAWGVMKAMFEPDQIDGYLMKTAIRGESVRFCLENGRGSGVSSDSLERQVRLTLSLYLEVLSDKVGPRSALELVDCDQDIRLKIGVGTFAAQYAGDGGLEGPMREDGRSFALVTINAIPRPSPDGRATLADSLAFFAGDIEKLKTAIGPVGNGGRLVGPIFADANGIDQLDWANSSFPFLLHEVGHAFGLSDMYDQALFESQTDPRLRGSLFQGGAMMGQSFANLSTDDVEGLRQARAATVRVLAGAAPYPASAKSGKPMHR